MSDISIDQATGKLKSASNGWEFGPELTLQQFEASEPGKSATRVSKISPHYRTQMRLADGHLAGLVLMFPKGLLCEIVMGLSDGELSWSDWTKERELSRKKIHDDFLRELLGAPPYDFPWGRVRSVIDPHDSTAHITIRYNC